MRPRDWCILGTRLLAIYLAVLAIEPLADALTDGERIRATVGLRFMFSDIFLSAATAGIALVLWKTAPRIAAPLLPDSGDAAPVPRTPREILTVGFVLTGIFLAATSIMPIVVNLRVILFASDPVHADSFDEIIRQESISRFIGLLVEGTAGVILAVGARRFARRGSRSPEES